MSLGVVVKGPEGVVLAADTRVTVTGRRRNGPEIPVNFDNATKLLTFDEPHNWVAAVTYGIAVIGTRTAHSFMPEFGLELGNDRLSTSEYACRLSEFFRCQWEDAGMPSQGSESGGMTFVVAGYDVEKPYGSVHLFSIPNSPDPQPRNPNDFGMTWGGQLQIVSRIIHGFDPNLLGLLRQRFNLSDSQTREFANALRLNLEYTIPYSVLPLQDCVDLATFLIRTTMTAQSLAVGLRGVGGAIDVATITRRDGLKWVQKKRIRGENRHVRPNFDH